MAHINLLPWREEKRQERQQQFMTAIVAGLIFSVAVLYGAIWYADDLLAQQNKRNTFLQTEISKLDQKIQEISALEKERQQLIARMQVIQQLQSSRSKVVKVFDSLVRTVPEGIHLDKVVRNGNNLTLNGIAQSNARVSVFMRELENNPQFDEPKLQVIQRTSTQDDAIRQFTLAVKESKPQGEL